MDFQVDSAMALRHGKAHDNVNTSEMWPCLELHGEGSSQTQSFIYDSDGCAHVPVPAEQESAWKAHVETMRLVLISA